MAEGGTELYDTTLRDGSQQKGMTLTVDEKLAVARLLDAVGVDYIEGGWPGAVPRDTEFFHRARTELGLRNARLAAFGSTRRPGIAVPDDPQVRALLVSEAPVITLVGKSHTGHVERALHTTLAENLAMIGSTVRHLVGAGRTVFLDAEHYFDGYRLNPNYALEVVHTAAEAGARAVVLCDTNGGHLPDEVGRVVAETRAATGAALGIHCHDDSGCAVANTLAATDAGAVHVQGTAHGYGERCGNADLFTVIANLVLKRGRPVVTPDQLAALTGTAAAVTAVTGVRPRAAAPYVGALAFTHKAGLHASALRVDPGLYQHTDPALLGNTMRTLVSDMGGRSSVALKARELGHDVAAGSEAATRAAARVKHQENLGYSFESADASFALLLHEELGTEPAVPPFTVDTWQVTTAQGAAGPARSQATLHARVGTADRTATGTGDTPVTALDAALRQLLTPGHPRLDRLVMTGHEIRALTSGDGPTTFRVLVSYRDGDRSWSTVGVGPDTLTATWQAQLDAMRYALLGEAPAETPGRPAPAASFAVA
ncbi:citramalate synthase [Streptomyces albidoflavus]|uniref:citramalate synthase n=1 Tax=Streptomyces sp. WAC00276 TaxID=2933778 RepID=UPI001FFFAA2C|nr:citramalate synthase [Streptomyces sp. WAC00276]MCK2145409.1 citramalate synthase [Streptomyces sp. WAC00276]